VIDPAVEPHADWTGEPLLLENRDDARLDVTI
jgi:hypothetical protein